MILKLVTYSRQLLNFDSENTSTTIKMTSTTTIEKGPICFWKHVDAEHLSLNDYKCAGIYQEPGQPAFALSLLPHEMLVHRGATLKAEKTKTGKIVIIAGWGGGESRGTTQFKIPESGQISGGDELPQIRGKLHRSLLFRVTPIHLNLQIRMLQEATD